jgi:hypothetical protein
MKALPVQITRDGAPGIHLRVAVSPVIAPDCSVPLGGLIKIGLSPTFVFIIDISHPASVEARVGRVKFTRAAVVSTKKIVLTSPTTAAYDALFIEVD